MKNSSLPERAGFAFAGWCTAWRRESSFRSEVYGVALIALVLVVLRPEPWWWAVATLAAALVLAIELVNSALEALVDLLHPGIHPEVKAVKDMLSGAVLAINTAAILLVAALIVSHLPTVLAILHVSKGAP